MKRHLVLMIGLLITVMLAVFTTACAATDKEGIVYSENWKVIKQNGKEDVRVLNLPDVRQSTTYTCGVSALQAVLFYYGIEYREGPLAEFAGSNEDAGTSPEGVTAAVEQVNIEDGTQLTAEIIQNATISDVTSLIDEEIPVIVDIQAWRDEDNTAEWQNDWIDGHYVVAIGYDDENLYFEDPSLMNSIGSIPHSEFLDRWHDYEGAGDYIPGKSPEDQNLIIVIQGEKPKMVDSILHID